MPLARSASKQLAPAPETAASAVVPQVAAKTRRLSYKEQRELESMPDKIQRLEVEQSTIQTAMSDANWFTRDPAQASAGLERLQSLAAELAQAYARWDALEALS